MTGEELKAFRKMVNLSQPKMAKVLGYGVRNYQMMEKDEIKVRNGVGLACAAYALGITHYDGPTAHTHWKKRKHGQA